MTTLIIVRHGNTFSPNETPLRVGARTDIPLVESGTQQARRVGLWLKQNGILPAAIYSGELKRTTETAELIKDALDEKIQIINDRKFNEIDYGPDEGKSEAEVIDRIGAAAIQAWDQHATVPNGWQVDPEMIIQNWQVFAKNIEETYSDKTVLVVTSNGIARFAPYLTQAFEQFKQQHSIKISTGAICILNNANHEWEVEQWNLKPA